MTEQKTARTITEGTAERITDPIEDIATMFGDLSAELGRVSDRILSRLADIETAQPATRRHPAEDGSRADRLPPPPTETARSVPVPLPGEPVDTSYARPVHTPAARAAGVFPEQGRFAQPAHPKPNQQPTALRHPHQETAAQQQHSPRAPFHPGPAPEPAPPLFDRLAHWTSRHGTKLLAWTGGAVTLLGIVLLLVMAVQQGWLNPLGRVVGGAALGAALVAGGGRVHRKSAVGASLALVATGIATLYLDVLAATALYGFLPAWAGLALGLALAGGGLWLADRWSSQLLAVGVVLACAVCAPLLFGAALATGGSSLALLTGFLVVLELASTPVRLRRGWPALAVVSTLPAVLSALAANGQALLTGAPWPAAGAALAVAVIGVVLACATAVRRPEDPGALLLLLASGMPVLLAAPMLERWGSCVVVAVVAGLYLTVWFGQRVRWSRLLPARLGIAAGGAGALALMQLTVSTVGGSGRSLALLGEAVVLALLANRLRGKGILLTATTYGGVGALVAFVVDVPPALFFGFPAGPYVIGGIVLQGAIVSGLLSFLLLGGAAMALAWSSVRLGVLPARHPSMLVATGLVLYGAGGVVLSGCLAVSATPGSFLVAHALITLSWVVLAFLLLLRGLQSVPHRITGFVLVFAALAKLALFDLAALDGLARVGTFLGAGLMLLVGGTRYARLLVDRQRADTSERQSA